MQDYLGKYQDLRDEWIATRERGDKKDISDDIVFELELIKQIEINIDYILMLVKQFHDSHGQNKEVLDTINKAINASSELRRKKQLVETFIANVNEVGDVMSGWRAFVTKQQEDELATIIREEKLKDTETRRFVENAFRDGEIKTFGTDIDRLMPPISRFGKGGRQQKKQTVIDRLKAFFERYFGINEECV